MWAKIAVLMRTERCFEWLKSFSHMCIPQHTNFVYSPQDASLNITTSCIERKQRIMCQCLSDTVTYTVSELLLASVTCCQLLESDSWEVKMQRVHFMIWHTCNRLEEPETDLFEAPVCKNKGAKARLYDNTCRCARYFPLFWIFVLPLTKDWDSPETHLCAFNCSLVGFTTRHLRQGYLLHFAKRCVSSVVFSYNLDTLKQTALHQDGLLLSHHVYCTLANFAIWDWLYILLPLLNETWSGQLLAKS